MLDTLLTFNQVRKVIITRMALKKINITRTKIHYRISKELNQRKT